MDAHEVLPLWLGGNLEEARQRHIQASPLSWVTPAAAPTLLIHGTEDKYVAYEQAVWMRDRLAACGVQVELLTPRAQVTLVFQRARRREGRQGAGRIF